MLKLIYSKVNKIKHNYKPVSKEELDFLKHHMPRGMVSMVVHRTGYPRWKIMYELTKDSLSQNPEIIQACREILFAVTGLDFESELKKRQKNN